MNGSPPFGGHGGVMLKEATLTNFRCFREASIRKAKRLNLVVGENGTGKTVLLEGLFLAAAGSPEIILRVNALRGLQTQISGSGTALNRTLWDNVFHNFDGRVPSEIRFEGTDRHTRSIDVFYENTDEQLALADLSDTDVEVVRDNKQIVFEWTDAEGNKHPVRPRVVLKDGTPSIALGKRAEMSFDPLFFSSNTNFSAEEAAGRFSDIQKKKKTPETERIIKGLFPSVRHLSVQSDTGRLLIFADVDGVSELVPLPFVSSGINKTAAIMLGIEVADTTIAFIDEIESGLHYSVFPDMWKALLKMAAARNVQLFVSTHSRECAQALLDTVTAKQINEIGLIRTSRERGASVINEFEGKDLLAALEYGTEFR